PGTSSTPPLPSGGLGGSSGSGGPLGGDKDTGDDNQPGGMIHADSATNSLIITASDPVYRNLRSVIDQLDARRAQVYIEALIVELKSTTAGQLGIQWQVASGQFRAGTNLLAKANGVAGNSIINLTAGTAGTTGGGMAANLANVNQGLNIGWLHNMFGVQGLGALLQYFAGVSDANVLSTPNLITLDNEEAKIVVGENVPIPTGSYSNLTSGTTSNAFNTYDRRDVGLTLHVKPQITDGGILKLQLYTENSAVGTATTDSQAGPLFTTRSIRSTILADNGEIIVLGGLMQDSYRVANSKVPLLGDIPWIGQLFRSESKQREKTNLMVFLRPVIIADSNTAQVVTANRYDYIQGVTGAYKSDNNVIRDKDDPVAPLMPLGPEQGQAPEMNLFNLSKMRRESLNIERSSNNTRTSPQSTRSPSDGANSRP
uniref:type II secretion system secretin GspD n=1 Tax=Burkholderia cenocepacia TaxID=95486 RepID=UPI002AB6DFBE